MKDLADSKRLFNTIRAMPDSVRSPVRGRRQGHNRGIGPVSATIISALFWPQLQKEQLVLPDQVAPKTAPCLLFNITIGVAYSQSGFCILYP